MDEKDLKDYLDNGYEVLSSRKIDVNFSEKINPVILDKKAFEDHLLNDMDDFALFSYSSSEVMTVYKALLDAPIRITPALLLKRLKEFKNLVSSSFLFFDNIIAWVNSLSRFYNQKRCYFPVSEDFIDEKLRLKYLPDYMFSDDDHLVSYILYRLKTELNDKNVKIELENDIVFVEEILDMKEEKESYGLSEMSIVYILTTTKYLRGDEYHTLMDDSFRNMYQTNLPLFATNTNIPICFQELGDNYFYARFDFKKDLAKAESNYLKAYNSWPSSYLALRLGDIYDALDNEESIIKAYQYYSISYITDQNNEATYKLADFLSCGRGVNANADLAFDILLKRTDDLVEQYRLTNNSDLFHFATRIGIMYLTDKENIHSLNEGEKFLLLARGSFKERYHLDKENIDFSYSRVIEQNIAFLKRYLNYQNRRVSNKGGYIVNKNAHLEFDDVNIKCQKEKDNYYHLLIQNKDNSPILIGFNEIFFTEKVDVAHFIVKINDEFLSLLDFSNIDNVSFSYEQLYLSDPVSRIGDCFGVEELIYRPSFDYSVLYQVVCLYSSIKDESYYFLTDKKYDINSKIIINFKNEKISTVVKENLLLYEDELPFDKADMVDLSIVTKN